MPNAVRERVCTACPPWVVRCAHLPDGRIVLIITDTIAHNDHKQGCHAHPDRWPGSRYAVGKTAGYEPHRCGCGSLGVDREAVLFADTDDLPQAHAAFEEREAALEAERLDLERSQ